MLNRVIQQQNINSSPIKAQKKCFANVNFGKIQDNFVIYNEPEIRPPVLYRINNRETQIVSFTGLKNPINELKNNVASISFGGGNSVYDRDRIRFGPDNTEKTNKEYSELIQKLIQSGYKQGDKLNFEINQDKIQLIEPNKGECIGEVPKSIASKMIPLIETEKDNYQFEIGLLKEPKKNRDRSSFLIDLSYIGEIENTRNKFRGNINEIRQKNLITPKDVLKSILNYNEIKYGMQDKSAGIDARKNTELSINTIAGQIKSSSNKKILIITHRKTDCDTLGCAIGLKNAIDLMGTDKKVDIGVDETLPGLLRNIPGSEEVKSPPTFLKEIEIDKKIESLRTEIEKGKDSKKINSEIETLKKVKSNLEENTKLLNNDEKYDLVILMDVPVPDRLSEKFAGYIKNARNVIYIDHHKPRIDEWDKNKDKTGIDMQNIKKKNLFWVEPRVPACTEMITILASKLVPLLRDVVNNNSFNTLNEDQQSKLKKMVSGLATGTITDTSGFKRSQNDDPHDILPQGYRPTFSPKGLVNWLYATTNKSVNKFTIRRQMKVSLPKNPVTEGEKSPYQKMLDVANKNKEYNPKLGLGFIENDYDNTYNIWLDSCKADPKKTLTDVTNSFKFNEVTLSMRFPKKGFDKNDPDKVYENDKILVILRESDKKGELNSNFKLAEQDILGMSVRSVSGTDHAELIASIFGGGGHAAASGASINGANLNSKILVKKVVNGQEIDITDKPKEILSTVKKNNYLLHNKSENPDDKPIELKVEVAQTDKAKPVKELISSVVNEIRESRRIREIKPQQLNNNISEKPAFGLLTQKAS